MNISEPYCFFQLFVKLSFRFFVFIPLICKKNLLKAKMAIIYFFSKDGKICEAKPRLVQTRFYPVLSSFLAWFKNRFCPDFWRCNYHRQIWRKKCKMNWFSPWLLLRDRISGKIKQSISKLKQNDPWNLSNSEKCKIEHGDL